jgi:hypothetical protein
MTGNPTFPTPNPPLTAVSGAVNALQAAETAALTRATGTVATRNEKRATLVALLELLRGYVQSVADATPENAISIIESSGFALRKTTVHAPRVFAAKATTLSGTVKLIAPPARSSCRLSLAIQHRRRQDLGRRVGDAAGEDDRHGSGGRDDGPVPLPLGHQGRSE